MIPQRSGLISEKASGGNFQKMMQERARRKMKKKKKALLEWFTSAAEFHSQLMCLHDGEVQFCYLVHLHTDKTAFEG